MKFCRDNFKHIKPDDPEFAEIAKTITPIGNIYQKPNGHDPHRITAEQGGTYIKRHQSDIDKLR